MRDSKCTPRDDLTQQRRRRLTNEIPHFAPHPKGAEKMRDYNGMGMRKKLRDDRFLAPGESCDESVYCDLNAYCTEERLCRCSPTFVQAGRQCIPRDYVSSRIVAPGAPCQPSDFCDGGASCLHGMCLCSQGFNPAPVGVCAPTQVGPGEGCAEGERCSRGSLCVGGLCMCPVETEERHGRCVARSSGEKLTFQKIAKSPGVPCAANPSICSGGSLCVFGVCTCPAGTTNVGGTCVSSDTSAYAVPGGSCSTGQTCAGNSICVASFCICPGGEKIRDGQCISVDSQAAPGQQCDAVITTCSGNSVCTNNVCTCPQNMVALNGQCANVLAQVNVGGGSTSSSSCPSPCPPNSYCQSGACICQMGYNYQQGQGCTSNSPVIYPQPIAPMFPSSGLQPIVNGGQQLQPAGSYCGSTAQCGSYSICQDNACRCLPGYSSYSMTGGCSSMQDPGTMTIAGTIYVPTNVGFDGSNSIIGTGYNTGSGFFTSGGSFNGGGNFNGQGNGAGNGIRNANLGAPGQECDFLTSPSCRGGSFCSNGRCLCGNGLVIGQESCVPYSGDANPGESCSNAGVVCRGGSTCIQQTCTCDVGFVAQGSICVSTNGGGCSGGSCGMNPGDSGLITTLRPGDQCDPSCDYSPCPAKCGYGSVCVDMVCNCALGTTNMGGFCGANDPPVIATPTPFSTTTAINLVTARPGDRCDVRIICNGGSQCILGICQCPQGYVPSGDRSSCVLASLLGNGNNPGSSPILPQTFSSYSKLGAVCLTTADCPEGASCADRVCTCNADTRLSEGKCVVNMMMKNEAMHFPGSRCLSSLTCLKGSHCFLSYCVCLSDMTTNATGHCEQRNKIDVLPRALPGAQCANGERCEGGSACVSGYCICQGDEQSDAAGLCRGASNDALPRLGSSCSSSTDCSSLPNSICHQAACLCAEGYERVNESCLKVAALPMKIFSKKITKCTSYKDCSMPRVCGPRQTCECPFTMAETDEGECVFRSTLVSPGSPCPSGEECGAGSQCLQGTCVCPQGLQLTKEQCLPYPNAPGGSCEQSPECTGGSSCMGGTCLCPSGFTKPGEACRVRRSAEGLSLSPPASTYTLHYDNRPEGLKPCPGDGTCALPACACSSSGTAPPASLLPSQTPQMIVITFEGAVTDRTTRIYKSLFSGRLKSHDCPLRATFFVSHEYTNYDQVQWLAARGNEIGVAGMGSSSLSTRAEERWRAELQGMRMALAEFSKVETESIRGVRAPGMKTGGDSHFAVLSAWNFTYDHSIAPDGGPFWPQTLDHTLPFLCTDGSCPTKAFKGVWEAPVNRIITTDGRSVARLRDAVRSTDTRASVADLLRRNLARNYQGSRAPLVLSLDADFMFSLPQNEAVNGLIDFLEETLAKPDVYPVTVSQLISWMKSPTSIDRLAKFKPFHCPRRANDHVQPCETPSTCSFITPQGSRSFRVCGSCPRDYPNIDDPLGKGRR